MNSIAKEMRILFAVVGLGLICLVLIVHYTDVCQLQAVTLNGEPVSQWDQSLGLTSNRNLFRQPLDSVANSMLLRDGIVHVAIKYQLPNGLSITTNTLEPVCYVLDEVTGVLYGIDQTGRSVTLEQSSIDWEQPIITGVRVRRIHDFCSDSRVITLVPQLLQVRQDFPEVYRLMEDVNLSNPEFVRVSISGLRYVLRLPSDNFAERFTEFQKFMGRFRPATDGISAFDLTYNDMIIRVGNVGQKKKPVLDTSTVNDIAQIRDDSAPEPALVPDAPWTPIAAAVKPPKPTATKKTTVAATTSKKAETTRKASAGKKSSTKKGSSVKPNNKKNGTGKAKPSTRKNTRKTS